MKSTVVKASKRGRGGYYVTVLLLMTVLIATGLVNPVTGDTQISASEATSRIRRIQFQAYKSDPTNLQMSRRMLIGSTAPTCTYNECRGCKFRCRAEQIPVDGNDPIHSAYHYKCICHR